MILVSNSITVPILTNGALKQNIHYVIVNLLRKAVNLNRRVVTQFRAVVDASEKVNLSATMLIRKSFLSNNHF